MINRKDYLNENRSIFDDLEPDTKHFERFEKRLNRHKPTTEKKQLPKIKFIAAISIAASIVAIILLGNHFVESSMNLKKNHFANQTIENEFFTANSFYKRQMDQQIIGIQCKLEKTDRQTQNQLLNDLQNIIKENDNFVKNIQSDENKALAIFYLIKHYQIKLQKLQFINDKLENFAKC